MKDCIQSYSNAVEANLEASKAVMDSQIKKRKAYYALIRAKEEMHAMEREILQDQERDN